MKAAGGHALQLKIVRNTVVVFLGVLTVLTISDYLLEGAIASQLSAEGLFGYFSQFMLLNVAPILAIFSVLLFLYTAPIQKAQNLLVLGKPADSEVLDKAKQRIFSLPKFVLLLNFISFFGGTILFFSTQGYWNDLGSPRLYFQLTFTISSAIVYSFIQTSLNRQVLAKLRELMEIHEIEEGRGRREMNLSTRTVFISAMLAVYAMSYMVPKLVYAYEIERSYSEQLYKVAQGEITLVQADAAFAQLYSDRNRQPDFAPSQRDFSSELSSFRMMVYAAAASVILIAFLTAFIYSREIILQIKIQQQIIRGILSGEQSLTKRISITAYDEVGELSELINSFMDTLEDILSDISNSSGSVSSASGVVDSSIDSASSAIHEIVASVEQISGNAGEQSASVETVRSELVKMQNHISQIGTDIDNLSSFVEETAGAMNEMAGNITSVTSITQQADELGTQLAQAAKSGEEQLLRSIATIETVQSATEQVGQIVELIADISAQTNLLAMNAAIEAAHAGDAGRGFAVVADEVRKLAENSSNRTREIIEHINSMTQKVEEGVSQTREAGEAFRRMLVDITSTADLVNEISSAMMEQKTGTDEILSSVGSVVDTTGNIKNLTQELEDESQKIGTVMKDLVDISAHIRDATQEQSKSNSEFSELILQLKETSRGNVEVVGRLEGILRRFNLAENGAHNE